MSFCVYSKLKDVSRDNCMSRKEAKKETTSTVVTIIVVTIILFIASITYFSGAQDEAVCSLVGRSFVDVLWL